MSSKSDDTSRSMRAVDVALDARRIADAREDVVRWISDANAEDDALRAASRGQKGGSMESSTRAETAAEAARARGNASYRAGRYEEAIEHYTESAERSESATALANRSMCWLKLARWSDAEADCDAAARLEMDCALRVKVLQRRGTAKRELGKLLESVMDFEEALRYEPTSKILREERARSQRAFELESKVRPTQTRFRIPVVECDDDDGEDENDARDASDDAEASMDVDGTERVVEASSATARETSPRAKPPVARDETSARSASPVTDDLVNRAAAIAASRPVSTPRTGAEFERAYRAEMKAATPASESRRADILRLVPLDRITTIFAGGIDPDVLADVVTIALERWFPADADAALAWLERLRDVPRFAISVALRPRRASLRLSSAFDAAPASSHPRARAIRRALAA
ncbi:Tetratricopeptide repeat [Ostreococcus tauri]|uniref:Tetratricopeptide repeat n=2 Tax=Ostreococcus tauri TaxID=70448 RepID=A0A090M4A2_OSTTA|nr:Tetratricopeptide repeat [Ostreococcus tauri]CEF96799.1 Tetratricopeptide repeat [Ostreococcus tauri]|eukprot:XP_022838302.1 Tetratricopeptide repeat [Ostreococcus tauri]